MPSIRHGGVAVRRGAPWGMTRASRSRVPAWNVGYTTFRPPDWCHAECDVASDSELPAADPVLPCRRASPAGRRKHADEVSRL